MFNGHVVGQRRTVNDSSRRPCATSSRTARLSDADRRLKTLAVLRVARFPAKNLHFSTPQSTSHPRHPDPSVSRPPIHAQPPPLQSSAFEAMFTREREHELFSPWGGDVPQNFRDDIVQRLEALFDTLHPPKFGTYTL